MPVRFPIRVTCVIASLAFHGVVLAIRPVAPSPTSPPEAPETLTWVELPTPEPEPEPEAPPPSPRRPPRRRTPKPFLPAPEATAEPAPEGAPLPTVAEGTLEVVGADDDAPGHGAGQEGGRGAGKGRAGTGNGSSMAPPAPVRKPGQPQVTFGFDTDRVVGRALIGPTTALLVAFPGYREMLRGSGIQPFTHLTRMHLRLPGTSARALSVAGVHGGGEQAIEDAAERVAAMHRKRLLWRSGAGARATAWAAGRNLDRGLALAGSHFLLGPRARMPALLGSGDAAAGLARAVGLRRRVIAVVAIEDGQAYLSELGACAPQALRVSLADAGGEDARLALTAHYRTAEAAQSAAACLARLPDNPLRALSGLLASARGDPDSFTTRMRRAINDTEITRLFEGIAWALREAAH